MLYRLSYRPDEIRWVFNENIILGVADRVLQRFQGLQRLTDLSVQGP